MLDASGCSAASIANIADNSDQTAMIPGHEIFDPEVSRRVLVDHASIACDGEITKAAKNWLGSRLDGTKRYLVMFMDKDDILNLYVVTKTPLPASALPPKPEPDDDIPRLGRTTTLARRPRLSLFYMSLRADFLLRIAANDNNGRHAAYLQISLAVFRASPSIAHARLRVPVSTQPTGYPVEQP